MGWIVAYTHPSVEPKAAEQLRDAGFNCFFPQTRKQVVVRGRRAFRIQPLFSRYLLVEACLSINNVFAVRDINGAILTVDRVTQQKQFALVRDEVVNEIKSRCDRDGFVVLPDNVTKTGLIPGQRVRPTVGAFVDRVGVYEGMLTKNRETAIFGLFGRGVSVSFKLGELLAA